MKKNLRILFCASSLSLLAALLFAEAKASKEIWVSPEKDGTHLVTDSDGEACIELDEPVDLTGYKYLQIECSSPDIKKVAIFSFDARYSNDDGEKSATIMVKNMKKRLSSFQGHIYGEGAKYYDYWKNGRLEIRTPEKISINRLALGAFTENYSNPVPGANLFVKKITATNEPLGTVHTIDLSGQKFLAIGQKIIWDDGSTHYQLMIKDIIKPLPKQGDIVSFKIKGKNVYDFEDAMAFLIDETNGWSQCAQTLQLKNYEKDQSLDERWEFILTTNPSDMTFQIQSYEDNSKGPYLILFE